MPTCSHIPTCALFPLFKLRSALNIWQQTYCESSFERCARFQRSKEGKSSPMNLLPNGALLTLSSSDKR
jgi:hypothetical protein